MKKHLLFLIVFGYLYCDMYLSEEYKAYPVEETATSRAGVHVSFPCQMDDFMLIPYIENETYMRIIGNPTQINYIAGFKLDFGDVEFNLYHECQHPIQKDIRANIRTSIGVRYIFGTQ